MRSSTSITAPDLLPAVMPLLLALWPGCIDVVPADDAFAASADADASDSEKAEDSGPPQDSGGTLDTADASGIVDTGATQQDAAVDANTAADTAVTNDSAQLQDGGATVADTANPDAATSDAGPVDGGPPANPCAGKADKSACDDGDPCTTSVCQGGKCVTDADLCECKTSADCQAKDDGNACNGTLYCDTAIAIRACKVNPATIIACPDDGNTCTTTSCDKKTGACQTVAVPDVDPKKVCEDGNKCTASDFCEKGQCQSGVVVCACVKQADCAAQEDGDACNGTLFCDLSSAKPTCKLNPASPVTCAGQDAGGCALTSCDKKTGACVTTVAKDLAACEDGDPCTSSDTCKNGGCVPGPDLCQCKTAADCAKFDDGNACNGTLYCDVPKGTCKPNPKTVVVCPSGTACAPIACDGKTGICTTTLAQKFSACDADGNPCTVDDTCDGKGSCEAGTDVCVCDENQDCAKHEDGDACNGTLYCDKLAQPPTCKPNPKTVVTCPAASGPCQVSACDPKSGKCETSKLAEFSACSDGDKCTVGDVCEAGACKPGPDLCACTSDADCLDDGDLCNGVPFCDKAAATTICKVKPGSQVTCDASLNKGCVQGQCAPKTGLCAALSSSEKCDDGNGCSIDSCDPKSGQCKHAQQPDGTPCDGQPAPAKFCATGTCTSAPAGMILIGATTLPMGCNKQLDDGCEADEKPQHEVKLKGFWIDRHEVTAAAYSACVKAGNCPLSDGKDSACNHTDPKRAQHPANCLPHAAAEAFCKHAGKRLPTEAEWELAARGGCTVTPLTCAGSQPKYPWQLNIATCDFAVLSSDAGHGCGLGTTRAVGTFVKDRSPFGARDMGGNVAEWVADWYAPDYYANSPAADPPGPATATMKVVRGGHFQAGPALARASNRNAATPPTTAPWIGFRCAKDP